MACEASRPFDPQSWRRRSGLGCLCTFVGEQLYVLACMHVVEPVPLHCGEQMPLRYLVAFALFFVCSDLQMCSNQCDTPVAVGLTIVRLVKQQAAESVVSGRIRRSFLSCMAILIPGVNLWQCWCV
jgi:hypothetical protein